MAATKSGATLQASASNAANATTTSSSANLTTYYGAIITAKVTNGASAPTAACNCTVNVSNDNTNWKQWAQGTAGLAASTAYAFSFEIPAPVMYAQVVFSGNTGAAVTVEAQAHYLTGL